jgi:hypothetical protein
MLFYKIINEERKVRLENPTVTRPVKKLPAFHEIRMFTTVLTTAHYWLN